ncbi:MAG: hypothetical protein M0019_03280 [Actinomycetota bacterium]|nr:hypothetical protein [Actinomycetota bacterium]
MAIVKLPQQLMKHANISSEVVIEFAATSIGDIFDQLEREYPSLRGTLRDPTTKRRRAYIRIFAQQQDISDVDPATRLASELISSNATIHFVTAISGG